MAPVGRGGMKPGLNTENCIADCLCLLISHFSSLSVLAYSVYFLHKIFEYSFFLFMIAGHSSISDFYPFHKVCYIMNREMKTGLSLTQGSH